MPIRSAVAPDPSVNFSKALLPALIAKVDSSIQRYRARFCNGVRLFSEHLQSTERHPPVAANLLLSLPQECGARPPQTKAVTGHRTPKS